MSVSEKLAAAGLRVERLCKNARTCQREGAGTHRNAGDAGRVAALWIEAKAEAARILAALEEE